VCVSDPAEAADTGSEVHHGTGMERNSGWDGFPEGKREEMRYSQASFTEHKFNTTEVDSKCFTIQTNKSIKIKLEKE